MGDENEILRILKLVEQDKITAEEARELIEAITGEKDEDNNEGRQVFMGGAKRGKRRVGSGGTFAGFGKNFANGFNVAFGKGGAAFMDAEELVDDMCNLEGDLGDLEGDLGDLEGDLGDLEGDLTTVGGTMGFSSGAFSKMMVSNGELRGGSYGTLNLNNSTKILDDATFNKLIVAGNCLAKGNITSEDTKVMGSLKGERDLTCDSLTILGSVKLQGRLTCDGLSLRGRLSAESVVCDNIKLAGRVECKTMTCDNIKAAGSLSANKVSCDNASFTGTVVIDDELKADSVVLNGSFNIKSIVADSVEVKKASGIISGEVTRKVESIECDSIRAEALECDKLICLKADLSPDCVVSEIIYKKDVE